MGEPGLGCHHRRHAGVQPARQPEEELRAERIGDEPGESLSHLETAAPARDLAGQVAEGVDVVAVHGARLPVGRLAGQLATHEIPVVQVTL